MRSVCGVGRRLGDYTARRRDRIFNATLYLLSVSSRVQNTVVMCYSSFFTAHSGNLYQTTCILIKGAAKLVQSPQE